MGLLALPEHKAGKDPFNLASVRTLDVSIIEMVLHFRILHFIVILHVRIFIYCCIGIVCLFVNMCISYGSIEMEAAPLKTG